MNHRKPSRGDRIRTCDRLFPKQERYRAALHPAFSSSIWLFGLAASTISELRVQRYNHFLIPPNFCPIFFRKTSFSPPKGTLLPFPGVVRSSCPHRRGGTLAAPSQRREKIQYRGNGYSEGAVPPTAATTSGAWFPKKGAVSLMRNRPHSLSNVFYPSISKHHTI